MARKVKAVKLNAIEGGSNLVGTEAADQFVLREGQGNIVVEGFGIGDKILFDFNSYSDVFGPLGRLSEGLEFSDFTGLTNVKVSASDVNGDGIADTTFLVNDSDSITLLGVAPDSLYSGSLMGG
jgi:hypothetical protein